MKEFIFENQGSNTFLICELADQNIDSMSLGMITNNRIPGFAQALFTQLDNHKFLKYNVSAKISLKQFFTGQVSKKRLLGVFRSIVTAFISAEEYMIDNHSIVLDLDYIFVDVSTCKAEVICVPVLEPLQEKVDMLAFFKTIMFGTQFDATENCDYVAKIMNFLNSSSVLSMEKFNNLLRELEEGSVNTTAAPVKPAAAPKPVQGNVQQAIPQPESPNPSAKPGIPQGMPASSNKNKKKSDQPKTVSVPQNNTVNSSGSEKSISWWYLMQHYNKENAALYKEQKNQKKQKKSGQPSKKNVAQTPNPAAAGFAIPGQPAPAVAGQKPPQMGNPQPSGPSNPQPAGQFRSAAPQNPSVPGNIASAAPASQPGYQAPVMPQGQSMNFGETTVLNSDSIGETTVLGASALPTGEKQAYLIRIKNSEKIKLDKPVFRIGKEKSYVDYFIGDNTAVSRSHANVVMREDEYYIVDTNSTNHTYVNDVMIPSNTETRISDGTRIKLANEEFEFRMI